MGLKLRIFFCHPGVVRPHQIRDGDGCVVFPGCLPFRSLRSAWLTLHAVKIRPIHPIFFSRSSARALDLSLLRTHVLNLMAIEAAFPTTCSSLVTSPASSFLFLSGMESVSAGRVQAITGAILSYSSSASAQNLDPIAFRSTRVILYQRKKENRQPKGGMGGRYTATTQGF